MSTKQFRVEFTSTMENGHIARSVAVCDAMDFEAARIVLTAVRTSINYVRPMATFTDTHDGFVVTDPGERAVDAYAVVEAPRIAQRVTIREARHAFDSGAEVLVHERGNETELHVTELSTVHHKSLTTWDALATQVREWRGRYPNQRFYVVR